MASKVAAWAFNDAKALAGAMVSKKVKGAGSIRRAFNVVISSMGLEVASVISVAGVWGTSWVAGVCSDNSMLRFVVELDVRCGENGRIKSSQSWGSDMSAV